MSNPGTEPCECGHGPGSHAQIGGTWECWMCNCTLFRRAAPVGSGEGHTDEAWEQRIQADFQKHPGAWRKDPEGWFREGWIAGYNARRKDGP